MGDKAAASLLVPLAHQVKQSGGFTGGVGRRLFATAITGSLVRGTFPLTGALRPCPVALAGAVLLVIPGFVSAVVGHGVLSERCGRSQDSGTSPVYPPSVGRATSRP